MQRHNESVQSTRAATQNEATKATNNVANRRRALGDITNTNVSRVDDNATKKPVTGAPAAVVAVPPAPVTIPIPIAAPETAAIVDPRAYMQRPSDDIDLRDAENPLLVTVYVNDTYDYFMDAERQFQVNPNYMLTQTQINDRMRSILIDWLVSALSIILHHALCVNKRHSIFCRWKCI